MKRLIGDVRISCEVQHIDLARLILAAWDYEQEPLPDELAIERQPDGAYGFLVRRNAMIASAVSAHGDDGSPAILALINALNCREGEVPAHLREPRAPRLSPLGAFAVGGPGHLRRPER